MSLRLYLNKPIKILISFLLPFLLYSCDNAANSNHGTNILENADLIAIYEREGYDEVYIVNPEGKDMAHYILVSQEDTLPSETPEDATLLRVPLRKLVLDSEVYASAMEELNKDDVLKGIFDSQYITSPNLKKKINNKKIEDVGQSLSPNIEKILAIEPEALLISYYNGMQTEGLDKLGIPIIKMLDIQEGTPLGRAEWLRFLGRLVGEGNKADSIFYEVKAKYNEVRSQSARSTDRNKPKVLTETIYEGIWSVPGGRSYQSQLIEDGGGLYFMKDDKTPVTLNLAPEQVVYSGGDSDVWLIKFYGDKELLKQHLSQDPVYRDIKAYKENNIFFSNTAVSGLYREFPFHPERLLEDYSIIFNGDFNRPLRYFQKIDN